MSVIKPWNCRVFKVCLLFEAQLENNKCPGPGNNGPRLLKEIANVIICALLYLFSLSCTICLDPRPVHIWGLVCIQSLALLEDAGVKVSRNAVPGPRNLSLEHSGWKIIGFHSRYVRFCAYQVSNLRYSNPIVNTSFKFHIFTKFYKIKKTTWNQSIIDNLRARYIIMGPWNERGARGELGARRDEQFPHLGNYTLTAVYTVFCVCMSYFGDSAALVCNVMVT